MPELPEVETTRRGLLPHVVGRRIARVEVRERRLRWPVAKGLPRSLADARVAGIERRAKYLLFGTDAGTLLVHLGMSGSLRYLPSPLAAAPHDHIDVHFEGGGALRFNDPRRFGSFMLTTTPHSHPLLKDWARSRSATTSLPTTCGARAAGAALQSNST
jgi:formamidopyrimidine-DNA glycosylase